MMFQFGSGKPRFTPPDSDPHRSTMVTRPGAAACTISGAMRRSVSALRTARVTSTAVVCAFERVVVMAYL